MGLDIKEAGEKLAVGSYIAECDSFYNSVVFDVYTKHIKSNSLFLNTIDSTITGEAVFKFSKRTAAIVISDDDITSENTNDFMAEPGEYIVKYKIAFKNNTDILNMLKNFSGCQLYCVLTNADNSTTELTLKNIRNDDVTELFNKAKSYEYFITYPRQFSEGKLYLIQNSMRVISYSDDNLFNMIYPAQTIDVIFGLIKRKQLNIYVDNELYSNSRGMVNISTMILHYLNNFY